MSKNESLEGTGAIDESCETIDFSRIVEIARGTIVDNISEAEMTSAKILMFGYQMGMQDLINGIESKINDNVNNMKNNAECNEINVEVDTNET